MSYMDYPFGIKENELMYFKTNRFYPNDKYFEYNQLLKGKKEIVSYDCGIFDLNGIIKFSFDNIEKNHQIMAIIIEPKNNKDYEIDKRFEFCGYDLCEEGSSISSITNCGCEFNKAIDYLLLNKYGLISDYNIAKEVQNKLMELYPEESHAVCQIIKIYRYISDLSNRIHHFNEGK